MNDQKGQEIDICKDLEKVDEAVRANIIIAKMEKQKEIILQQDKNRQELEIDRIRSDKEVEVAKIRAESDAAVSEAREREKTERLNKRIELIELILERDQALEKSSSELISKIISSNAEASNKAGLQTVFVMIFIITYGVGVAYADKAGFLSASHPGFIGISLIAIALALSFLPRNQQKVVKDLVSQIMDFKAKIISEGKKVAKDVSAETDSKDKPV